MPWWSWRPGSAAGSASDTDESSVRSTVRVGVPTQREPSRISVTVPSSDRSSAEPASADPVSADPVPGDPVPSDRSPSEESEEISAVTLTRIGQALDQLDIRFLADGSGSLLAMWERHAVLFTLEGPVEP